MTETRYGLRIDVSLPFDTAVARATDALKTEGFGVLTTIDVRETLKQKLDRDFRRYVILGACNPVLADKALRAELDIGLLLPCNVIVYERGDHASTVAAMAPLPAMGMIGNPDLEAVAAEADTRLRAALTRLEQSAPPPRITPGQALTGPPGGTSRS
jgi:uncharacterized protein (DUF302 family)